MKNRLIIVAAALLISSGAFAQKDELKTLKRIYDKDEHSDKDVTEYKAAVAKAETYLATATDQDKVYINYYKAEIPVLELNVLMSKPENQSNPMLAMKLFNPQNIHELATAYSDVKAYEEKSGKKVFSDDIDESVAFFGPTLLNLGVEMGKQKQYAVATQMFHDLYLMNKKNADYLYYAASYAVNGEDYDTALKYYDELKALNYSGESTVYMATSVSTGKVDTFNNKADRDKMVGLKMYTNPKQETLPSKRGEIYKNIALILVQKGKTEEAKAAFADAIKENPNDTSLLSNEATLYLQLKDYDTYKAKIAAILAKNPNDATMIYNLGVVALESNQLTEAETYFKRAIEIKPDYSNAYMNLAAIKLKGDEKIVDEMNKLGNTEKDNKRYAVLKAQRDTSFNAALPYLEKALQLDPKNEAVIDNLLTVYNFLEQTDKYKALKAKKKALEESGN